MAKLFANSGDPDQTLQFVASDLSLPCLPVKGSIFLKKDIFISKKGLIN